MKDHLEMAAKAAALFSIVVIVLSIFHEIGFFAVVGKEYRQLLSTGDYLANAVSWIPETVYFLFIGVVMLFALNTSRLDFSYRNPDLPFPEPRAERWARWFYYLTLVLGVIVIFVGPPEKFLALYHTAAWFIFFVFFATSGLIIRNITFLAELPRAARITLALVPILVTNSWIAGAAEGYRAIFGRPGVYTFYQSNPEGRRQVLLLRSVDKGLLVRDPTSRTVELIKWDKLDRISTLNVPREHNLLCELTGVMCPAAHEP